MDLLQDFSSGFWIVKRSTFKKGCRFIREEGTEQITEEKRWKRAALLLSPGHKEPGLKGPRLLGKKQLRDSKCWGILVEKSR